MSPFKRFVKFLLIFSLLSSGFLLFAVLLGFIFEKKLHRIALNELERISGSNINFSDSKVSFLRHWPDVTVNLTDLGLNPPGAKKGEDFIHASSMHVRLNFFSLFRDKYEINGLFLFDPELILNRNRDGKWNYEGIFEPQKTKDSKGACI